MQSLFELGLYPIFESANYDNFEVSRHDLLFTDIYLQSKNTDVTKKKKKEKLNIYFSNNTFQNNPSVTIYNLHVSNKIFSYNIETINKTANMCNVSSVLQYLNKSEEY